MYWSLCMYFQSVSESFRIKSILFQLWNSKFFRGGDCSLFVWSLQMPASAAAAAIGCASSPPSLCPRSVLLISRSAPTTTCRRRPSSCATPPSLPRRSVMAAETAPTFLGLPMKLVSLATVRFPAHNGRLKLICRKTTAHASKLCSNSCNKRHPTQKKKKNEKNK